MTTAETFNLARRYSVRAENDLLRKYQRKYNTTDKMHEAHLTIPFLLLFRMGRGGHGNNGKSYQ